MDAQDRPPPHNLSEQMQSSPWGHDFFHAVRRLECSRPDLPRIGASQRLVEDPVRFCQEPSLTFAPSTIRSFQTRGPGVPPRMFIAFMGLLGPNGPLPLHLTEYAHDRELNVKDHTFARFLDIFNHRMIAFFYRAWAVNQKAVHFERGPATWASVASAGQTRSASATEDRFIAFVYSLFGVGMPTMLGRDVVPDLAKAYYSGHLVNHTRHADGLRSLIQDYFRIPCSIVQFVGQWMDLPKDCYLKLGGSRQSGRLGLTTIVGSRIWECQQKFRIRLGPMNLDQYTRMLPPAPAYEKNASTSSHQGESLKRLASWVRLYTNQERSWDAQLILKKEDVPRPQLGKFGRLGWSIWTATRPLEKDAQDLVLNPKSA